MRREEQIETLISLSESIQEQEKKNFFFDEPAFDGHQPKSRRLSLDAGCFS